MQDLDFRQLVERVKLRSPIEDVVGDRVADLRRRGSLFWSRCPFHEERTPSFAVDPRRGTWHCFGACGAGGDVFSFVQRFDGLSFLDALRLLAQACGEVVPEVTRRRSAETEDRFERLRNVLERAQRLYAQKLFAPEGRAGLDYVRARGFEDAALRDFGLGWAPESGNPLVEGARRSGVADELLLESGLAKRADDGRVYDFFRARLMIPVQDRLGRIVGFGGRIVASDGRPTAKYVNTPETSLFHKGRLIFGLAKAAESVRRGRHIVLVEGYTDVMAAHQAGVRNVVAVLGTATTAEHAELIRRSGARRVTLIFDGDEAGRNASRRALQALLTLGLTIDVASPPAGQDPCDLFLARGGGMQAFEAVLAQARDWFDWIVDGLVGRRGAELGVAVDELFELLAVIEKPVERDARLAELARRLELPASSVLSQWDQFRRRRSTARAEHAPETARQPARRPEVGPEERVFRALIGALLLDNSLIPLYGPLAPECPAGDLRLVFGALLELYERGDDPEPIDAVAVMGALGDHPARDLVLTLEHNARTAESPLALARDQVRWIETQKRRHALNELTGQLTRSTRNFEGEDSAKDVLAHIHQELRRAKVPAPGAEAGHVPIP